MKKKILFIDDEPRRIQSYVDELEKSGYEVEPATDVDYAFVYFVKNMKKIDLLIMDVMMPPGENCKDQDAQTELGLRTGILLSDKIRQIDTDVPIIVLTNVVDDELEKKMMVEKIEFFKKKIIFLINL